MTHCAYAYNGWIIDARRAPSPHHCRPLMIFGRNRWVWSWLKNWHVEDVCTPMCERGLAANRQADRCPDYIPEPPPPPPAPWWLTRHRHG